MWRLPELVYLRRTPRFRLEPRGAQNGARPGYRAIDPARGARSRRSPAAHLALAARILDNSRHEEESHFSGSKCAKDSREPALRNTFAAGQVAAFVKAVRRKAGGNTALGLCELPVSRLAADIEDRAADTCQPPCVRPISLNSFLSSTVQNTLIEGGPLYSSEAYFLNSL